MTFLTNASAFEDLERHSRAEEASRSSYWQVEAETFEVTRDGQISGTTVLGNHPSNTSRSRALAHAFFRFPFLSMGLPYGRAFRECLKIGKRISEHQGRVFSYDMLRQVLSMALIRSHVKNLEGGGANLVIGDGYGVFTSLLLSMARGSKTISVNLTKPLLIDATSVRKALPDIDIALAKSEDELVEAFEDPSIALIIVQADQAHILRRVPIDLAVNLVSMQEMDLPVINEYFRTLRENPAAKTTFYCCNRLMKQFPDGSIVRFQDYPWDPQDRILHDSSCPWGQWYYSRSFPFWRYRVGQHRVIWHRLVELRKSGSAAAE